MLMCWWSQHKLCKHKPCNGDGEDEYEGEGEEENNGYDDLRLHLPHLTLHPTLNPNSPSSSSPTLQDDEDDEDIDEDGTIYDNMDTDALQVGIDNNNNAVNYNYRIIKKIVPTELPVD